MTPRFARHRIQAQAMRATGELEPTQRLAHAVLAQAMDDAERGDAEARAFIFAPERQADLSFWTSVFGISVEAFRGNFNAMQEEPIHA